MPQHHRQYTGSLPSKSSNTQFGPTSGPPPQAELYLDKLLVHIVSLNGTLQPTLKYPTLRALNTHNQYFTAEFTTESIFFTKQYRFWFRMYKWQVHNVNC